MLENFGQSTTYSEEYQNKTNLIIAQQQVENLLKLSENFEYTHYIQQHLYSVKYELIRQFNLLDKNS